MLFLYLSLFLFSICLPTYLYLPLFLLYLSLYLHFSLSLSLALSLSLSRSLSLSLSLSISLSFFSCVSEPGHCRSWRQCCCPCRRPGSGRHCRGGPRRPSPAKPSAPAAPPAEILTCTIIRVQVNYKPKYPTIMIEKKEAHEQTCKYECSLSLTF